MVAVVVVVVLSSVMVFSELQLNAIGFVGDYETLGEERRMVFDVVLGDRVIISYCGWLVALTEILRVVFRAVAG